MFTSPQVMTIILDRDKGFESNVNFEYPFIFNLEKYVVDKKYGENYNYELIGVITHLGARGKNENFIAFCKSPVDNNWYCYKDAKVFKSIEPKFHNNNKIEKIPYALFYQKIKANNENNQFTLFN